jgi:hypothetical protein
VDPSPELYVAIGSAILSIASGLLSARASNKARTFEYELERRRKLEDASERAERILHQYREPLIDAAHTLQGRLLNIMKKNFLRTFYVNETDEALRAYARDYTVYAIAEYLTWVEVLRREMRFQDLGDAKRNRDLMERLTSIQYAFQRNDIPSQFVVFRGLQRAIAEVMMVPTGATEGPRTEPMGYAAFVKRLDDDPDFASWFASLRRDVDTVAHATYDENVRLTYVQRELIDLIDFLDEKMIRVPANVRTRLDDPDPQPVLVPAQKKR